MSNAKEAQVSMNEQRSGSAAKLFELEHLAAIRSTLLFAIAGSLGD
jgi:hypothetical protein